MEHPDHLVGCCDGHRPTSSRYLTALGSCSSATPKLPGVVAAAVAAEPG